MIPKAGPTCWPRPGPSSRAGPAGRCRPRASFGPSRSGRWTRRPDHLVCQGDGGHEWLRWDQELGDFIYHVEWRFTPVPGKKGYNSGVYARNSADGRIYHQAQTGDGSGGYLFGNTESKRAPKRFNLSKQQPASRVKPPASGIPLKSPAGQGHDPLGQRSRRQPVARL